MISSSQLPGKRFILSDVALSRSSRSSSSKRTDLQFHSGYIRTCNVPFAYEKSSTNLKLFIEYADTKKLEEIAIRKFGRRLLVEHLIVSIQTPSGKVPALVFTSLTEDDESNYVYIQHFGSRKIEQISKKHMLQFSLHETFKKQESNSVLKDLNEWLTVQKTQLLLLKGPYSVSPCKIELYHTHNGKKYHATLKTHNGIKRTIEIMHGDNNKPVEVNPSLTQVSFLCSDKDLNQMLLGNAPKGMSLSRHQKEEPHNVRMANWEPPKWINAHDSYMNMYEKLKKGNKSDSNSNQHSSQSERCRFRNESRSRDEDRRKRRDNESSHSDKFKSRSTERSKSHVSETRRRRKEKEAYRSDKYKGETTRSPERKRTTKESRWSCSSKSRSYRDCLSDNEHERKRISFKDSSRNDRYESRLDRYRGSSGSSHSRSKRLPSTKDKERKDGKEKEDTKKNPSHSNPPPSPVENLKEKQSSGSKEHTGGDYNVHQPACKDGRGTVLHNNSGGSNLNPLEMLGVQYDSESSPLRFCPSPIFDSKQLRSGRQNEAVTSSSSVVVKSENPNRSDSPLPKITEKSSSKISVINEDSNSLTRANNKSDAPDETDFSISETTRYTTKITEEVATSIEHPEVRTMSEQGETVTKVYEKTVIKHIISEEVKLKDADSADGNNSSDKTNKQKRLSSFQMRKSPKSPVLLSPNRIKELLSKTEFGNHDIPYTENKKSEKKSLMISDSTNAKSEKVITSQKADLPIFVSSCSIQKSSISTTDSTRVLTDAKYKKEPDVNLRKIEYTPSVFSQNKTSSKGPKNHKKDRRKSSEESSLSNDDVDFDPAEFRQVILMKKNDAPTVFQSLSYLQGYLMKANYRTEHIQKMLAQAERQKHVSMDSHMFFLKSLWFASKIPILDTKLTDCEYSLNDPTINWSFVFMKLEKFVDECFSIYVETRKKQKAASAAKKEIDSQPSFNSNFTPTQNTAISAIQQSFGLTQQQQTFKQNSSMAIQEQNLYGGSAPNSYPFGQHTSTNNYSQSHFGAFTQLQQQYNSVQNNLQYSQQNIRNNIDFTAMYYNQQNNYPLNHGQFPNNSSNYIQPNFNIPPPASPQPSIQNMYNQQNHRGIQSGRSSIPPFTPPFTPPNKSSLPPPPPPPPPPPQQQVQQQLQNNSFDYTFPNFTGINSQSMQQPLNQNNSKSALMQQQQATVDLDKTLASGSWKGGNNSLLNNANNINNLQGQLQYPAKSSENFTSNNMISNSYINKQERQAKVVSKNLVHPPVQNSQTKQQFHSSSSQSAVNNARNTNYAQAPINQNIMKSNMGISTTTQITDELNAQSKADAKQQQQPEKSAQDAFIDSFLKQLIERDSKANASGSKLENNLLSEMKDLSSGTYLDILEPTGAQESTISSSKPLQKSPQATSVIAKNDMCKKKTESGSNSNAVPPGATTISTSAMTSVIHFGGQQSQNYTNSNNSSNNVVTNSKSSTIKCTTSSAPPSAHRFTHPSKNLSRAIQNKSVKTPKSKSSLVMHHKAVTSSPQTSQASSPPSMNFSAISKVMTDKATSFTPLPKSEMSALSMLIQTANEALPGGIPSDASSLNVTIKKNTSKKPKNPTEKIGKAVNLEDSVFRKASSINADNTSVPSLLPLDPLMDSSVADTVAALACLDNISQINEVHKLISFGDNDTSSIPDLGSNPLEFPETDIDQEKQSDDDATKDTSNDGIDRKASDDVMNSFNATVTEFMLKMIKGERLRKMRAKRKQKLAEKKTVSGSDSESETRTDNDAMTTFERLKKSLFGNRLSPDSTASSSSISFGTTNEPLTSPIDSVNKSLTLYKTLFEKGSGDGANSASTSVTTAASVFFKDNITSNVAPNMLPNMTQSMSQNIPAAFDTSLNFPELPSFDSIKSEDEEIEKVMERFFLGEEGVDSEDFKNRRIGTFIELREDSPPYGHLLNFIEMNEEAEDLSNFTQKESIKKSCSPMKNNKCVGDERLLKVIEVKDDGQFSDIIQEQSIESPKGDMCLSITTTANSCYVPPSSVIVTNHASVITPTPSYSVEKLLGLQPKSVPVLNRTSVLCSTSNESESRQLTSNFPLHMQSKKNLVYSNNNNRFPKTTTMSFIMNNPSTTTTNYLPNPLFKPWTQTSVIKPLNPTTTQTSTISLNNTSITMTTNSVMNKPPIPVTAHISSPFLSQLMQSMRNVSASGMSKTSSSNSSSNSSSSRSGSGNTKTKSSKGNIKTVLPMEAIRQLNKIMSASKDVPKSSSIVSALSPDATSPLFIMKSKSSVGDFHTASKMISSQPQVVENKSTFNFHMSPVVTARPTQLLAKSSPDSKKVIDASLSSILSSNPGKPSIIPSSVKSSSSKTVLQQSVAKAISDLSVKNISTIKKNSSKKNKNDDSIVIAKIEKEDSSKLKDNISKRPQPSVVETSKPVPSIPTCSPSVVNSSKTLSPTDSTDSSHSECSLTRRSSRAAATKTQLKIMSLQEEDDFDLLENNEEYGISSGEDPSFGSTPDKSVEKKSKKLVKSPDSDQDESKSLVGSFLPDTTSTSALPIPMTDLSSDGCISLKLNLNKGTVELEKDDEEEEEDVLFNDGRGFDLDTFSLDNKSVMKNDVGKSVKNPDSTHGIDDINGIHSNDVVSDPTSSEAKTIAEDVNEIVSKYKSALGEKYAGREIFVSKDGKTHIRILKYLAVKKKPTSPPPEKPAVPLTPRSMRSSKSKDPVLKEEAVKDGDLNKFSTSPLKVLLTDCKKSVAKSPPTEEGKADKKGTSPSPPLSQKRRLSSKSSPKPIKKKPKYPAPVGVKRKLKLDKTSTVNTVKKKVNSSKKVLELQTKPCNAFPNLPKCLDCKDGNLDEAYCRFDMFRRLDVTNSEQIRVAGFSSTEACVDEDLVHWVYQDNKDLDFDLCVRILRDIGAQFQQLVLQEIDAQNWSVADEKIWKRAVLYVREMCDICYTTIFNTHWTCHDCGLGVCLDCFRAALDHDEGKKDQPYTWPDCEPNVAHYTKELAVTQIIPRDVLVDLLKDMLYVSKKVGIEFRKLDLLTYDAILNNMGTKQKRRTTPPQLAGLELISNHISVDESSTEDHVPNPPPECSWLCDNRMLHIDNPYFAGDAMKLFQSEWRNGMPVLVSNVQSRLDKSLWSPASFSDEFGHEINDVINCYDGRTIENLQIDKFWVGFESIKARPTFKEPVTLLKLKDWPPKEDFMEKLPKRFADVMQALPAQIYTNRDGELNLASRLPNFFAVPDLGPKMYSAYGSSSYPSAGTTNLHLDVSDATNVIAYVGIPKEEEAGRKEIEDTFKTVDEACCEATRRRIRQPGVKPGALWHIFPAHSADKIRKFLKRVADERGMVLNDNSDPIHDQSFYLDCDQLEKLRKEEGVVGFAICQCYGDAVFIPAGAPHQVLNLHSCIKVAEDFVAPEHISHCFQLTQEFRFLSDFHTNHEDKLQIKNILFHSVKDCLGVIKKQFQL